MQRRCEFTQNHISQNFRAIVIILVRILDKAEAIDVTNKRLAVRPAKTIVTAMLKKNERTNVDVQTIRMTFKQESTSRDCNTIPSVE